MYFSMRNTKVYVKNKLRVLSKYLIYSIFKKGKLSIL